MKRLGVRVRTLLILVVFAGIAAGGLALWRRSGEYAGLASLAEFREENYAEAVTSNEKFLKKYDGHPSAVATQSQIEEARVFLEEFRARREYYAALKLKYQRASLRPWLLVEPDPPVPPTHEKVIPYDPRNSLD